MNTTSSPRTILCYGDSNTHGQIPASYGRYPLEVRWTGALQKLLGENYRVIEEGLGGRTVDLDDTSGRNGYDYFVPCLSSHQPLDTVVIMLGTNDLKVKFDRSVAEIIAGLRRYIERAQKYTQDIILISPIILDHQAPEWLFYGPDQFDETSVQKSKQLVGEIAQLAREVGCRYMAASDVARVGADGIHIDEASQAVFAKRLAGLLNADRKDAASETDLQDELNKFLAAYETAANSRNFAAVAPYIADDASFWFTNGKFEGIAAIRQAFEDTWANIQDETYTISKIRWTAVSPQAASCSYDFTSDGMVDGERKVYSGKGMNVLARRSGSWHIVHEHLSM